MITLAHTPVLETDRLILRAPEPGDWPHWRPFYGSSRAQYIGGPLGADKAWRAFGHFIGHWVMRGFGSFVVTRRGDNTPIGSVGPWFPEGWPEREIGWTIWDPAVEGTGIAFEAASAARDFAYTQLNWDGAVSYIDAPNTRSIALAERMGAKLDPDARAPDVEGDKTVLVYRHPNTGAAS